MQKQKSNIKIKPENCSQCLSCMLTCSIIHSKSFNPSQAHLQIIPGYFDGKSWNPTKIEFRETCKPKCNLCTEDCVYGALIQEEDSD